MPAGLKIRNINPQDWFQALIYKEFVRSTEQRIDPGWHHPSSLAHPCDRYKQFKFIGAPEEGSRSYLLAFTSTVGTFIHATIQSLVENHPAVIAIEEKCFDEEARVRGQLDLRVKDPDSVENIIDIKTVNILPKQARPKDIIQVLWYMKINKVIRGTIIYITRGSGAMSRFSFEWKGWSKIWDQSSLTVHKITVDTLNNRLSERTPPDRKFCEQQCSYVRLCDTVQSGKLENWLPLVENTKEIINASLQGKTAGE